MKIEHFAINVEEPAKVADWYCEHLSMSIAHKLNDPANTHFLSDSSDNMMFEIYNNSKVTSMLLDQYHPLQMHLAFVSIDPVSDSEKLCRHGATFFERVDLPNGSILIMLRDPWGMPIQLCKRN